MEARGSKPTETTSAHHFKVNGSNQFNSAHVDVGVNYQAGFHEYSLDWESNRIRTYVNGQLVLDDSQAVPQTPMFLLMNTAVGGFFDGVPDGTTTFPQYFNIDWVRVWQPAAEVGDSANGGFEDYQGPQWANWNTKDEGNLSASSGASAIHGGTSLLMDAPPNASNGGRGPNMFTDGTAGGWSGWLNEFDAVVNWITGYGIDPTTVPATVSGGTATFGLYQSAVSPIVNAVIFRQIGNADIGGKSVAFTGDVAINTPFAAGTEARAFIRVFDPGFGISQNVSVLMTNGGSFSLQANVPANSPFVQFGLDTIGPPAAAGQLTATNLYVSDDAVSPSATQTFAEQTVLASPGQSFRACVIASSDGSDPLSAGATAEVMLDFLDASGAVVSSQSLEILRGDTPGPARARVLQANAPSMTTQARLRFERKTIDDLTETGGKVVWDSASLQNTGSSNLPVFTSEPAAIVSVNSGDTVNLDVTVNSSSPLTFQWYRDGVPAGISEDLGFTASEADAGNYYLVASNDAGPVVGALTELTVAPPGLQSWKESNGISAAGDLSDDEPDSVTLLEEYAYNMDPTAVDLGYVEAGSGTSGLPVFQLQEDSGNSGQFRLVVEYLRRLGDPNLQYIVEFSNDLSPGSWNPGTGLETVSPIDANWERVVLPDSESSSTHPRRFGRVTVSYSAP